MRLLYVLFHLYYLLRISVVRISPFIPFLSIFSMPVDFSGKVGFGSFVLAGCNIGILHFYLRLVKIFHLAQHDIFSLFDLKGILELLFLGV